MAVYFPIFERMALNPKLHHIIIGEIKKVLGKKSGEPLSRYEMAKGTLVVKRVLWNAFRNTLQMTIGIASAAFGLPHVRQLFSKADPSK